jgi:hypothetical protein
MAWYLSEKDADKQEQTSFHPSARAHHLIVQYLSTANGTNPHNKSYLIDVVVLKNTGVICLFVAFVDD